ncbi:MAG: hypothetical protein AAF401_15270 [Pseudomonadota bacterium]
MFWRRTKEYGLSLAVYADVAVLRLEDRRYFSDSQRRFEMMLRSAAENSESGLVILDMGEAIQVTSGPLGAMRIRHQKLVDRGGRIVAAGGGEFAVKVLNFAAKLIDYYPTVEDALSGAGASAAALEEYRRAQK